MVALSPFSPGPEGEMKGGPPESCKLQFGLEVSVLRCRYCRLMIS